MATERERDIYLHERSKAINVRVSGSEYQQITDNAAHEGLSVQEYVRRRALSPPAKSDQTVAELSSQLGQVEQAIKIARRALGGT